MKKFIVCFTILTFILVGRSLHAQAWQGAREVTEQDTLLIHSVSVVDSTLVGKSVFDLIQSDGSPVVIHQSEAVRMAFSLYLENNLQKKKPGYRIRIFFDNKQSARTQSENIEKNFIEHFPLVPVYRVYTNPYFKVAVGDFRTRSDAVRMLNQIKDLYPNAFIIRDVINYPL